MTIELYGHGGLIRKCPTNEHITAWLPTGVLVGLDSRISGFDATAKFSELGIETRHYHPTDSLQLSGNVFAVAAEGREETR